MKKSGVSVKKIIILIAVLCLILAAILFITKNKIKTYADEISLIKLVTGTGNSGLIMGFSKNSLNFSLIYSLNTGYLFVHTVRIGDINNDKKEEIVAGVSNSFFSEPYGCKVEEYSTIDSQQNLSLIDDVGDVRCKDLAIGDADNDGKNEVLLGTHGEGYINLYKKIGGKWEKTVIEDNYIGKIDAERNTTHKVARKDLTYDAVVNSAVHIVKIGDIDNDGRNEVVATISSPLEFLSDEISFIRVYKYDEKLNVWNSSTLDELHGREFRSIAIGDLYGNGKNVMLIGIGTPEKNPGSVYLYSYDGAKWNKELFYNDSIERNMKGLTIGDLDNDGKNEVALVTGFPNGVVHIFKWDETKRKFSDEVIGRISDLFNLSGAEFNSMAVEIGDFDSDSEKEIIVGGTITYPSRNIGWEGADSGYLVMFKKGKSGKWQSKILDTHNILAIDTKR